MFITPRFLIAALRGGAGKTLLSIAVVAALHERGLSVAPFKKGPDYIDAAWLGQAAQRACRNLDAYIMGPDTPALSFVRHSLTADIAVIEGSRGLFDGSDGVGASSSAELAKTLGAPVILVIDATKMTRTAAALALGCKAMDPDLKIGGIVLNRVAGARHEKTLRDSIRHTVDIPLIGAVPKLPAHDLPQRHLGLLTLHEHPEAGGSIGRLAQVARDYIDLEALVAIARDADPLSVIAPRVPVAPLRQSVRIGVIQDGAFQFYYPENLEALERQGAHIVRVSALSDQRLPEIDALYIGGGFPETHAAGLSAIESFRSSVKEAADAGLPVYAECGGLMYLTQSIIIDGAEYPMAGVFEVQTILERKPQGLGYIEVTVVGENPFYPKGALVRGHEFHYSRLSPLARLASQCVFRVNRGCGMGNGMDGLIYKNTLASYMHVHACGTTVWAENLAAAAATYAAAR